MILTKNDEAWIELFKKIPILREIRGKGHFIIKAEVINGFREARLMTKFDHRSQLPTIFTENNLSILPLTRGSYIISDFETFFKLRKANLEPQRVNFPTNLESLDFRNITSEATAINCTYVSNILSDFLNEEELKPTVSGRMRSSSFTFNITAGKTNANISVNNSQIEIDGGYEGEESLTLVEAKNYISDDFLIRQLYYPYRLWANKIKKKVRTVFLTYTNGTFHLREFAFQDLNHYNSLVLIREKKYVIREEPINHEIIQRLLAKAKLVEEPEIPFPQANSFARVINLCELLNDKVELTQDEITANYDFADRQTNYYTDAARYLGFVDKKKVDGEVRYFLTPKGKGLFKVSIVDRQLKFVREILSHKAFNETLALYFKKSAAPNKDEIVEIMKDSNLYEIESTKTFYRRSSTIKGWVNWILSLIEE